MCSHWNWKDRLNFIIIIIIIATCYGATQPMLSSALQPYSLYNTV